MIAAIPPFNKKDKKWNKRLEGLFVPHKVLLTLCFIEKPQIKYPQIPFVSLRCDSKVISQRLPLRILSV